MVQDLGLVNMPYNKAPSRTRQRARLASTVRALVTYTLQRECQYQSYYGVHTALEC